MFGTKNSRNDEYFSHRHICTLNYTRFRRVSCRDETTKCVNWFLLDTFKVNNCFLPEGKNSQPPCKSFSYRLVSPFFHFSRCGDCYYFFTCSFYFTLSKPTRQVGSFVQNFLFARNLQCTKISAAGLTLGWNTYMTWGPFSKTTFVKKSPQ